MKTVVKSDIVDALRSVGLQRGDSVMVHTSLGKIVYVCGGAQVVIEALIESVGEEGTIMMPAKASVRIPCERKGVQRLLKKVHIV